MTALAQRETAGVTTTGRPPRDEAAGRSYWPFVLPAVLVVGAVIVFPWAFTIWMSLHAWTIGGARRFVGLANYLRLGADERFAQAIWHTLVYTTLAVLLKHEEDAQKAAPKLAGLARGGRE